MNANKLGQFVAETMDEVERQYENLDVETEIGEILVVMEVRYEKDDQKFTEVTYHCTDGRAWVQNGLLTTALQVLEFQQAIGGEDEDIE